MELKRKLKALLQPTLDQFGMAERTEFYSQFVGDRKLFFDVGANVGNRTSVFRKLGVRVVAVEPQRDVAASLRKKFLNDKDVVVVNMGLGETEGEAVMQVCTSASTLSTFSQEWTQGRFKNESFNREERIPMTTLDALISEYGVPDFCKIDVEGYEFQVLRGLTSKIPSLSFEFTSEFLGWAREIVQSLEMLRFSEFSYSVGEDMAFIEGWVSGDRLIDSLQAAVARDPLAWGDVYAR